MIIAHKLILYTGKKLALHSLINSYLIIIIQFFDLKNCLKENHSILFWAGISFKVNKTFSVNYFFQCTWHTVTNSI